ADADAGADERSVRAARSLPRGVGLLDLHDPVRRQPAQHRRLVWGLVQPDAVDEPKSRDADPGGREAEDADSDPLIRSTSRSSPAPPTTTHLTAFPQAWRAPRFLGPGTD